MPGAAPRRMKTSRRMSFCVAIAGDGRPFSGQFFMQGAAPRRMKLYRNPLDCALRCTTRQSGGLRYSFRTVLHAGCDATTDEAVEYCWPFGVHAMEAVE